ncbi:hypothetical protein BDV10DRAFT_24431 [Aspergillus recurvatus]
MMHEVAACNPLQVGNLLPHVHNSLLVMYFCLRYTLFPPASYSPSVVQCCCRSIFVAPLSLLHILVRSPTLDHLSDAFLTSYLEFVV